VLVEKLSLSIVNKDGIGNQLIQSAESLARYP